MNHQLQTLLDTIQQNENLSADEKGMFSKAVKDVDKELAITAFKLDRTEKVKRTTAILLEETIEELEQKRKAVEAQNRELEIESSLERVRSVAMGMQNPAEMVDLCKIISEQLEFLKVKDIRNVQTAVIYESKGTYINYEYYARHNKLLTTEVSYKTHHLQEQFANQMLKGAGEFFSPSLEGQQVKDWYEYQKTTNQFADSFLDEAQTLNYYMFSLGPVALGISTYSPLIEEEINLFKRFRNVFELAYRKFLDITKAEEHAREAQIEAALERVRSRSLAMHTSADLSTVVYEMFTELVRLDAQLDRCLIMIVNPETLSITWYLTGKEGLLSNNGFLVQNNPHPSHQAYLEGWRTKRKKWDYLLAGEEKRDWDEFGFTQTGLAQLPDFIKTDMAAVEAIHLTISSDDFGCLIASSLSPLSETHSGIVDRFTTVFNQTYTRFLDLQKAEAQARESQIEAALERIRSRALAMHNSPEVGDVSDLLFSELEKMDINPTGFSIMVFDREHDKYELWRAKEVAHQGVYETLSIKAMYDKLDQYIPGFTEELESKWNSGSPLFIVELSGRKRISFIQANREMGNYTEDQFENVLKSYPDPIFWHLIFFKHGWLGLIQNELLPADDLQVIRRFADVFEFAHTRFLDLQKAEAQARETQIEAALERVRSKTMAMHNSADVGESVATLFDELLTLGVLSANDRCGIGIMHPDEIMEAWTAAKTVEGKAELTIGYLNMAMHPLLKAAYGGWKTKKEINQYILQGDDKHNYHEAIRNQSDYKIKRDYFSSLERIVHTDFYFTEGCLYVFSSNEFTSGSARIFIRFTNVFGQTYRRYLDLQKAEAQAREAQIEAALERVRASSMAMHKSEQLAETAKVLFEQFDLLGRIPDRISIGIIKEEKQLIEWWVTNQNGSQLNYGFNASIAEPSMAKVFNAWKEKKDSIVIDLTGKDLKDWIRFVREEVKMEIDEANMKGRRVHQGAFFSQGVLLFSTHEPVATDVMQLLVRFARVFSQTYTRFLDLQKAEMQAKEAIKASSLDRVRGEIASMRTINDLQRITPIIWHELNTLGVPFVRCGVFIMNESTEHIQVHLSSPDGSSLGVLDLPFNSSELTINSVNHWRQGIIFKTHWNKHEFLNFMQSMIKEGQVQNPKTYQGAAAPPESLDLHFIPFKQGMLYVGNSSPLEMDELQLVKSLAESFSIAYARYEDFRQLEEAKNQIEKTFTELKAAQAQLIQSEKMASLGELTAGIAHEIQNPLNFVNNFSEVSKELIVEMNEELAVGNIQLANEIADDIKQNLEKINHHGKRAADIVKGMLQHSRTSSGVKETTDINALADEYLRLAYHGLRAKDKSFNAEFKTDFDPTLSKINIIPQDIGRMLLNLIHNAFYAVDKRAKESTPQPSRSEFGTGSEGGAKNSQTEYRPTVTISTTSSKSSLGDFWVKISVKDNGSGIPAQIVDKIFQPFFTTKPTGQGTGLGLSLSYDIVKAHGGELKVETTEGEGSEFIIILPTDLIKTI